MQRRAHESTSGVPVQWPVSVVQKPLGLRQSEKIPSKNFRVQRLEMAKQMKNIRQQRADERDKAAQIFTWCMVVAMLSVGLVFNAAGVKDVLLNLFNQILGA